MGGKTVTISSYIFKPNIGIWNFSPGAKYEVGTYKWDVLEQDPGSDHTVQSELEHKVIENGINNNNREHQQGLRTQS